MSVKTSSKMGFNATWSMAVGGMVGGGIFATLGLVIQLAGEYAWVAYLIGGIAALITGISYESLARHFDESGGAFIFLREVDDKKLAGNVSWLLILSYVLTISVYAFTFGHYLEYLLGIENGFVARFAAASIIIVLTGINLRGVSSSAILEIVSVWIKVLILLGLSLAGLMHFSPDILTYEDVEYSPIAGIAIGAAVVFMAYEGFQLLAYDYDDIKNPKKTLPLAIITAILSVIGIYILITLGTTAITGPGVIVEHKEIALAKAGEQLWGTTGLVVMSVAAVLSTASAINSTLFATARLSKLVADDKELPSYLAKENDRGVPSHALLLLGAAALILAVLGNLGVLVEGASLLFLIVFGVVNGLAAMNTNKFKSLKWAGCVFCGGLALFNAYYIAVEHWWVLAVLFLFSAMILILRNMYFNHENQP